MVGEVTEIGVEVTKFQVGDAVVVGNIVDSCGRCPPCKSYEESYCREFPTTTYDGIDRHDGSITRGSYSNEYVVKTDFAYHLPSGLDPASVAPLLCAGVQHLLDFCSKHKIAADVEVISAADINEGFEQLEQGDVHYRLVIDMATLKAPDGNEAKS